MYLSITTYYKLTLYTYLIKKKTLLHSLSFIVWFIIVIMYNGLGTAAIPIFSGHCLLYQLICGRTMLGRLYSYI